VQGTRPALEAVAPVEAPAATAAPPPGKREQD